MGPHTLIVIAICLALVCLTIALVFSVLGFWLILPFAGLEIFLLGFAIGYTIRRSGDTETITVDGDQVVVTRRVGKEGFERTFQRYWARVMLEPSSTRLGPTRLKIGSHGRYVEVAQWATDEAREKLAACLKEAMRYE